MGEVTNMHSWWECVFQFTQAVTAFGHYLTYARPLQRQIFGSQGHFRGGSAKVQFTHALGVRAWFSKTSVLVQIFPPGKESGRDIALGVRGLLV